MEAAVDGTTPEGRQWYACYTRGRHEKQVERLLGEREFEVFLPLVPRIRQWHDREKVVEFPLFPSYVFARFDGRDLALAAAVPGLVNIVRFNGRPVAIPEEEIENIRLLSTSLPPAPEDPDLGPWVEEGEVVEIISGPLTAVRGVVAERRGNRRLIVVVGVAAIDQGLRVEVDRAAVRTLEQGQAAS